MKTFNKTVLITALGALGLVHAAPAVSQQKISGEVRAGFGYISEDAFRMGRFTGMNTKGVFTDLAFRLQGRDPFNGQSTRYWRIEGTNLGLDSRHLRVDAGAQGRFSTYAYYRERPAYSYRDVKTPYFLDGNNVNPVLPGVGGAAGATWAPGTVFNSVHMGTKRERGGVGGRVNLSEGWGWRASGSVDYELKEGLYAWGLPNTASTFPMNVDHETVRYEADITYDGGDTAWQGRLGIQHQTFKQQDGMSRQVQSAQGAFANQAFLTTVLEPDNEWTQVTASGFYTIPNSTFRVSADLAKGRMTQDAKFQDDITTGGANRWWRVNNPGVQPDSLDAEIDTTLVNLRVSGKPTDRINLRAGYRYEDRDNKTPQLFRSNQVATLPTDTTNTRYSRPVSSTQTRYDAEASYMLQPRTHITAGVIRDEWERDYDQRAETDDTEFKLGLRTRPNNLMQIRAELAHSRLRGSDWLPWTRQNGGYRNEQGNNSFEFINPVTGVPFVGDAPKLYLAERDRNRFQAFVSYQATSDLLITPRVQWVKDDYIDSETGLQDFERRLLGIDASYLANERTTLYAWVGLEQFDADQTGGQLTAGNGNPIAPNNNQARWFVNREDTVQSIGFGGEYEHIPGKLTYGSEISYVKTSGEASSRQPGVFVGTESLPDIETTWTQFSLFANYVVAKNLDLNVRYLMERYEEKDYGHDWDFDRRPAGAAGGPYTLLGIDSPDYTAHLVAATVRYRF